MSAATPDQPMSREEAATLMGARLAGTQGGGPPSGRWTFTPREARPAAVLVHDVDAPEHDDVATITRDSAEGPELPPDVLAEARAMVRQIEIRARGKIVIDPAVLDVADAMAAEPSTSIDVQAMEFEGLLWSILSGGNSRGAWAVDPKRAEAPRGLIVGPHNATNQAARALEERGWVGEVIGRPGSWCRLRRGPVVVDLINRAEQLFGLVVDAVWLVAKPSRKVLDLAHAAVLSSGGVVLGPVELDEQLEHEAQAACLHSSVRPTGLGRWCCATCGAPQAQSGRAIFEREREASKRLMPREPPHGWEPFERDGCDDGSFVGLRRVVSEGVEEGVEEEAFLDEGGMTFARNGGPTRSRSAPEDVSLWLHCEKARRRCASASREVQEVFDAMVPQSWIPAQGTLDDDGELGFVGGLLAGCPTAELAELAELLRESTEPVLVDVLHEDRGDAFVVNMHTGMGPSKRWASGSSEDLPDAINNALRAFHGQPLPTDQRHQAKRKRRSDAIADMRAEVPAEDGLALLGYKLPDPPMVRVGARSINQALIGLDAATLIQGGRLVEAVLDRNAFDALSRSLASAADQAVPDQVALGAIQLAGPGGWFRVRPAGSFVVRSVCGACAKPFELGHAMRVDGQAPIGRQLLHAVDCDRPMLAPEDDSLAHLRGNLASLWQEPATATRSDLDDIAWSSYLIGKREGMEQGPGGEG